MILVGIDGGGTKTHALALNEHGKVIGAGIGGQSNYHQIGLPAALRVLQDVCQQALQGERADVIAFCLADCDTEIDRVRLSEGIAALNLAERFVCYNDSFAALRAGSTQRWGVGIICGTGFNACAIGPDGRTAKLHSLGPLTGDWGGGYGLGEAVFGAVYRADEGRGAPTTLSKLFLEAMQVDDLEVVTQRLIDGEIDPALIAGLAPLVFAAADRGDQVALALVRRQADEIAVAALALLRRLGMLGAAVDVVLAGGVLRGGAAQLIPLITRTITADNPSARIHWLSVPPVIGAAFLAFDQCGLPTSSLEGIKEQLAGDFAPESTVQSLVEPGAADLED